MSTLPLLALLANTAFGYSVKTDDAGNELYWATTPITISLNTEGMADVSDDAAYEALENAAGDFDEAEGSELHFVVDGQPGPQALSWEDEANVVYFTDDWEALGHDESLLAMTYTWFLDSGEIIGFDMVVNTANHDWATDGSAGDNDLHNTLTHELGHAAGLGHSDVEGASMFSTTFPGELEKRALHADDKEALAHLYGEGSFESQLPLACSSAGRSLDGSLSGGLFALTLAGLMRRRRDSDPTGAC